MNAIRAGIFGASGYTGVELAHLLTHHPRVALAFATSRTHAGKTLDTVIPGAPALGLVPHDEAPLDGLDVAFLCLPHAAAAPTAARALAAGAAVVDLSADFRLRDADSYARWYGIEHPNPELLPEAVYGLTEYARDLLPRTRLVANPGCYPTSILLALGPLLTHEDVHSIVRGPIIADSKSGVSGAGRAPKQHTHFVEVADNFSAYAIGRSHRHLPEIEQLVSHWWRHNDGRPAVKDADADVVEDAAKESVEAATTASRTAKLPSTHDIHAAPSVLFTPHLLPVRRGILSTIYVPLSTAIDAAVLRERYEAAYADEPFVSVFAEEREPSLAHVVGSNRCVMALDLIPTPDGPTLLLRSAIDNLLKGAAGQAVQNMNAMLGLPETEGLA
jgi:N-acetyl-gamma-glutamyl-phosphate reductase